MMYPDEGSCRAAALSLHMAGRHPGLGYSATEGGAAALNVGTTYMATDGDALATFSAILAGLAGAALVIPPPIGPVVGLVLGAGAKGVSIVSDYLIRSAKSSSRFLPIGASQAVLKNMQDAWGTWGTEAAKDKLCQAARDSTLAKVALGVTDLDCNNSMRTAKRVYNKAVANGAPTWAAAMAAWKIAKDAGCNESTLNNYANLGGAVNAGQRANPQPVWAAKVKIYGLAVSSETVSNSPLTGGGGDSSGGGGAMVAVAAVVAALAFMG